MKPRKKGWTTEGIEETVQEPRQCLKRREKNQSTRYLQDRQPVLPCNLTPEVHGQSVPCRSGKRPCSRSRIESGLQCSSMDMGGDSVWQGRREKREKKNNRKIKNTKEPGCQGLARREETRVEMPNVKWEQARGVDPERLRLKVLRNTHG